MDSEAHDTVADGAPGTTLVAGGQAETLGSADPSPARSSEGSGAGRTLVATPQLARPPRIDTLGPTMQSGPELGGANRAPDERLTREHPGRYRFGDPGTSELGRGGLGRVVSVFDTHLEREVAWKEILPDVEPGSSEQSGSVAGRARFLREARITGRLEHPGIVPVYELGVRDDGTLYYTMKAVRGRTMRTVLQTSATLAERMTLLPAFGSLCHAVAFAHSRNVIHRDLKPENVMVGEFGETVLLDWGIAKERRERQDEPAPARTAHAAHPALTAAGSLLGTPAYMSPEQASGRIEEVDQRSDVWSLGAILFEILTGRTPADVAGLNAVVQGRLEPPRMLEPAVPRELEAICLRALRASPGGRYEDASAIAREVAAYQSGARVSAYTYSSWDLFARFARRNRALIAAAAALFVLAISSSVVLGLSYRREAAANQMAQYHLAEAHLEKASRLDADHNAHTAAIHAAASLLNNPAHSASEAYGSGFADAHPQSRELLVDALSDLYMARLANMLRLHRRIPTTASPIEVRFAPGGKVIAVAMDSGAVDLFDTTTGARLRQGTRHERGGCYAVAWRPDGAVAASGGYDGIRTWVPSSGEQLAYLQGHRREVRAVVLSQDGTTLLSGADDGEIRMWDLAARTTTKTLLGHKGGVMALAMSPDESLLVSGGRDGTLRLWSVRSGESLGMLGTHSDFVSDLAFTPDGSRVVSSSWDGTVGLWTVAERGSIRTYAPGARWFNSVALLGDGTFLTLLARNELRVVDAATGSTLLAIPAYNGGVQNVSASQDQRQVAFPASEKSVGVWETTGGPAIRLLGGHAAFIQSVAYSPDGRLIATASFDHTASLWDAREGTRIHHFEGHSDYVTGVRFSPDGSLLGSLSRDKTLRLWDVKTGALRATVEGLALAVNFAFDDAGTMLFVARADGRLCAWDIAARQFVRETDVHLEATDSPQPLPDGRFLVRSASRDAWEIRGPAAGPLVALDYTRGGGNATVLAKRSAIAAIVPGGQLIIADLQTGHAVTRSAVGAQASIEGLSADERLLLISYDGRIAVVDTLSGELLFRAADNEWAGGMAIAPDGSQLAIARKNGLQTIPMDWATLAAIRQSPRAYLEEAEAVSGRRLDGFLLGDAE